MTGNYQSLEVLAREVERQHGAKRDLLVPMSNFRMEEDALLKLGSGEGSQLMQIKPVAHQQIAEKFQIPKKFYDEIETRAPGLRSTIVNRLSSEMEGRVLVRGMEGAARAVLSDRYALGYDNYDLLITTLPIFKEYEGLMVKSLTLTERKIYIQLVFNHLIKEVKVGDTVRGGITLTNSEIGLGRWDILEFTEILRCLNGMVGQSLMRKTHIGKELVGSDEDGSGIFKADTIRANLDAMRLQIRDVVKSALDEARFEKRVEKLQRAAGIEVANPVEAIQEVTKSFQLTEDEGALLLSNMIKAGDGSLWGLSNAITAMAKTASDQDRAYEIEKMGAEVIEAEWEEKVA